MSAALLSAGFVWGQAPVGDLLQRGDAAYRAGRVAEAVELFEQALTNESSSLPANMMLGIIRAGQSRFDQAIGHFRAALEIDPANPHAHFYLGRLMADRQEWAKAEEHYSKALQHGHPDRESATIGLAAAESQQGRAQAAQTRLLALPKPQEPATAAAYHAALGLAQSKLGLTREAAGSFRKARDLQPASPAHYEELIQVLLSAGDFTAALNEAVAAQKRFPDHAGIQFAFGVAGFRVPGSPFTRLALRNLRDTHPSDPRLIVLEGLVQLQQGRPEQGRAALTRAQQLGVREAAEFLREIPE